MSKIIRLTHEEVVNQAIKEFEEKHTTDKVFNLKTKYEKLNSCFLDGLPLDSIYTLAGMSGGGKTAILRSVLDSIFKLNNVRISANFFNFEMLATNQIVRQMQSITGASKHEVHALISLEEGRIEELKQAFESIKEVNPLVEIYFIEVPGTPEELIEAMEHFYKKDKCGEEKIFLSAFDHLLLIDGENPTAKIDSFMHKQIKFKKTHANTITFNLAQLNRNIKDKDRIQIPSLHIPDTSCLMSSSAIEFASDGVIVVHMPAKLGISSYTTDGLPTVYLNDEVGIELPLPYLHILKNRSDGDGVTIPLENRLYKYDFTEMDSIKFNNLINEY